MYQRRMVQDGREFSIVKVYYDAGAIQERLNRRGFKAGGLMRGEYFFWLASRRGTAP